MTTTNTNDRLEEIIRNAIVMLVKYRMCEEESNIIRTACQEYAAEQNKELRAELEEVKRQFGTCSVCGKIAWIILDDKTTEQCEVCQLRAKHPSEENK